MADNDRIEGAARKVGGDIKEAAGKALGDSQLQAEGRAQKVHGRAQNLWGSVKDMFRGRSNPPAGRDL